MNIVLVYAVFSSVIFMGMVLFYLILLVLKFLFSIELLVQFLDLLVSFSSHSFYSGASNKYQFARPVPAENAAIVLGTTPEELSRVVFNTGPSLNTLSPSYKAADKDVSSGGVEMTGQESLEGFVIGLYAEVFQAVVSLINRHVVSSCLNCWHFVSIYHSVQLEYDDCRTLVTVASRNSSECLAS